MYRLQLAGGVHAEFLGQAALGRGVQLQRVGRLPDGVPGAHQHDHHRLRERVLRRELGERGHRAGRKLVVQVIGSLLAGALVALGSRFIGLPTVFTATVIGFAAGVLAVLLAILLARGRLLLRALVVAGGFALAMLGSLLLAWSEPDDERTAAGGGTSGSVTGVPAPSSGTGSSTPPDQSNLARGVEVKISGEPTIWFDLDLLSSEGRPTTSSTPSDASDFWINMDGLPTNLINAGVGEGHGQLASRKSGPRPGLTTCVGATDYNKGQIPLLSNRYFCVKTNGGHYWLVYLNTVNLDWKPPEAVLVLDQAA